MALTFKHPFTCIVAGSTGCGKTQFVVRLIENACRMIVPPPLKFVYCYGAYQPLFDRVTGVQFHDGLPDSSMLTPRTLLIIDDLMAEADERVTKIFTKHSHHQDVSIVFLTQNIFHKKSRTICLNAQYLVLFKNPRDAAQIGYLARQMYPTRPKYMMEAYADATTDPYTYMVVDLKPDTDEKLRLRSGIFPGEKHYAYVPK